MRMVVYLFLQVSSYASQQSPCGVRDPRQSTGFLAGGKVVKCNVALCDANSVCGCCVEKLALNMKSTRKVVMCR